MNWDKMLDRVCMIWFTADSNWILFASVEPSWFAWFDIA
jgi:hypothetical protein